MRAMTDPDEFDAPQIRRGRIAPLTDWLQAHAAKLLIATAIIFIAALAIQGRVAYEQAEAEARAEIAGTAQSYAQQLKYVLATAQETLDLLAVLRVTRNAAREPAECSRLFSRLLQIFERYAYVGFVDADGTVICGAPDVAIGQPVRDRPWFQRVLASHAFSIGDYAVGRSSGRPSVHFATPVRRENGGFAGAANLALDLEWLTTRLADFPYPDDSIVTLLDATGHILARAPGGRDLIGARLEEKFYRDLSQTRITLEASGVDDIERVYGRAIVGGGDAPMLLTFGLERDAFRLDVWAETLRALSPIALLLSLGLILMWSARTFVQRRAVMLERALANEREQEKLLFREVNHRIKNNLQVVISLVSLSGLRGTPRTNLINRIEAIALLHEHLYRSESLGLVDLGDYLRMIVCEHFGRMYQSDAVTFDCTAEPGLMVDSNRAMTVGLIVAELVTNALKHAFPDGRQGLIQVRAARADGAIELAVRDNGVGTADSARKGTGTRLLDRLAEGLGAELRGEQSGGTVWTMRFAAAAPTHAGD